MMVTSLGYDTQASISDRQQPLCLCFSALIIHAKICSSVVNTEADLRPSAIYKEQMKKIPPLPSSYTVLS